MKLGLSRNQLTGGIPPQLSSLTNLRYFSLSDNQLSGPVPTWMGSLADLQELYLSQNQLSGAIPSELGSLVNLQELHLSQNQLTGRLKELAKTQTIHRPPTAERIAQEVELIQPGMGHPAGAPAPASAPANADAVVELPGGRLVVHVHVHLSRDPLTLG